MRLPLIIFLVFLTGCSVPLSGIDGGAGPDAFFEKNLQNIRIERWGKVKFSGLLALKREDSGLRYILLDAMGVTLLQGFAATSGDYENHPATGLLADKGLAPFLSLAISRIYLQEPRDLPCSSEGFVSLCVDRDLHGDRLKKGKVLGFPYWTVHQKLRVCSDKKKAHISEVSYNQPLAGVKIFLHDIQTER